jgi:hypothetical protein
MICPNLPGGSSRQNPHKHNQQLDEQLDGHVSTSASPTPSACHP